MFSDFYLYNIDCFGLGEGDDFCLKTTRNHIFFKFTKNIIKALNPRFYKMPVNLNSSSTAFSLNSLSNFLLSIVVLLTFVQDSFFDLT